VYRSSDADDEVEGLVCCKHKHEWLDTLVDLLWLTFFG